MSRTLAEARALAQSVAGSGDYGAALAYLDDALAQTGDADEWIGACTDAVNLCVKVSWHRQSLVYADRLERRLETPRYRRLPAKLAALVVTIFSLLGLPRVARLFNRRYRLAGRWPALRALQFAHLWNDIERASYYAVLQLAAAETAAERRASLAWLGYALAYRGFSPLSVAALRHAIMDAHRAKDRAALADFYPLLGIAWFMNGRSARAQACFRFYDAVIKDAPEFYRLLTLTARINLAIGDGALVEAERAIGKCFSYSFAMQKSRHHIQIYGASAALAALDDRGEQARAYLAKARDAAEATDNNLDHLIYFRYAALTAINLGDQRQAAAALAGFQTFLTRYGTPLWYACQLERLRAACAGRGWCPLAATGAWLRSLGLSVTSMNLAVTGVLWRDARQYLFVQRARYWPMAAVVAYLRHRLATSADEIRGRNTGALAERVSAALLDAGDRRLTSATSTDGLAELLQRALPAETVVTAASLRGLVDAIGPTAEVTGFMMFDESAKTIRVPCEHGRFLVGMMVPRHDETSPELALGVLLTGLDVDSVSFAEGTFRLLVTDHSYLRAIEAHRARDARNRELVAVGQAAQMLAHDVRRPFSVLLSGIRMLGATQDPGDLRRGLVRLGAEVERSVAKVNTMITDVVASAGPLTVPRRESIGLEVLFETAVAEVFRGVRDHGAITVSKDLGHTRPLSVDAVQVGRVFANILQNAVQAMKGRGSIWLSTRDAGDEVEIVIGNDGSAIPRASWEQVFEAFYTSGKRGGTGLGLAIARKVVAAHGGSIVCRSGDDDVEFVMTLPATAAAAAPADRRARSAGPRVGGIVALADDDPFILEAWEMSIEGAVERVRTFASGEDLLAALRAEPDLLTELGCVVTDFNFGSEKMTGAELLAELRALDPALPVLLSSDGEFDGDMCDRFDQVLTKLDIGGAVTTFATRH